MNEWTVRREVATDGAWTLRACDADGSSQGWLRLRPDDGSVQLRFWYRRGLSLHGAPEIHVQRLAPTLTLCSDLNAFHEISEISSDDGSVTSLLLQAAGLWLARETAHTRVCAGVQGESMRGSSIDTAFFRSVSRHFLPANAIDAHGEISKGRWPAALAGLLPRHPIYLDLLPQGVRAELDQCAHSSGSSVLAALERNGLMPGQFVNVVDGTAVACGTLASTAIAPLALVHEVVPHSGSSDSQSKDAVAALRLDMLGDTLHLSL